MSKYEKLYPKKNDEVGIYNIKDEKILFDHVSGSIAKISGMIIDILSKCTGFINIKQLYEIMNLKEYGLDIEGLVEALKLLESKKFISIFERKEEMKKRVMLINPPFPYKHGRYNTYYYTPPLGILQIAGELENNDYKVDVIDMAVLNLTPVDIIGYIEKLEEKPSIIAISANMSFTYPNCVRIAQNIKDKYPEIPIILGGNHATFCYEDILKLENCIDFVTLFEGEKTVTQLCNSIVSGIDSFKECKGIAFKNANGEIIKTEKREREKDLDELAFPAYHLVPMELYSPNMRGIVMTSRGCPHRCIYCSTAKFNGNVAYKSIDRIIDEMKILIKDYGCKHIAFGDDAFTINKDRVLKICQRLKKENFDISWSCNTRVDMVDYELLKAIKSAGCKSILFGIESMNQKVLDNVSKRFDVAQIKKAVSMAKELEINMKLNYIIGLPYETSESLEQTWEYLGKVNPEQIEFCILCLFPGTDLEIYPDKFGIDNYKVSWDKLQLIKPGLKTKWMSSEEILENYISSWMKFNNQ